MAKKLVSRTAKVLSETKKTKDKEAVAIAYEHIPRNPEELAHGSIYAVIELEDKSGHAEDIAEKIIDVLHDTFYENTENNPLESFEASLAKINDELTDRSSEGQINWLGKLNAVLAIFTKNTLHVTQTGKAEAYLYRGDNSMHITEDLAGDSINPQRTFINIASGDLAEKDKVAFVTPGVFYKISKSELKEYTLSSSPKIASENISKLLSGENGSVKPNAVLLMEMVSPESFAADDEVSQTSESWVKEEKNKAEEVSAGVTGGFIKVFDFLGKSFATLSLFAKTKILPTIQQGATKTKEKISEFKKVEDAESIILESEEKLDQIENLNKNKDSELEIDEIDLDDGILETPAENSREIRIKETRKKPKLISVERFDFSFIERLKDKTTSVGKNLKLPRGKNSFVYIGVAAFLIAGLLGYLLYSANIREAKSEAENKITQAGTLYEESISEIEGENYRVASSKLESAEKLALEVSETKFFNTEADELLNKIKTKKDEANRITRNTAQLFYEFDSEVSQIFTDGTMIYGVNFENGTVYSVDPRSASRAIITENPNIGGKIKFATLISQRRVLVAYTDKNEIYEIGLTNGATQNQIITGGWEDANGIGHFGTNIYLLSPSNNQIYRHFKLTTGYGQKANYFSENQNLENTIGFTIDGSIYLTDANANIKKFTSGNEETFSLSNAPTDYSSIKSINTNPDTDFIYLNTDELVIKIDKNGKFISQYINDDAKSISSLIEIQGQIFFISKNKVYVLR